MRATVKNKLWNFITPTPCNVGPICKCCALFIKNGKKKRLKDIGEIMKILEYHLGQIYYWDGWVTEPSTCKIFPTSMLRIPRNHSARTLGKFFAASN